MARYPNGQIPLQYLVHLGGEHYLTPATANRWKALQADVYANEGVWLAITRGPNAYRSLEAQWITYRNEPPGNAAYPGTSSHGGVYAGRDSMAIDVGNWGLLGRDKFYAYARKHGFEPGYFDWEPWHIIDWSPWASSTGGGGVSPETVDYSLLRRQKEETMYIKGTSNPEVYNVFTDANGQVRMRVCLPAETSYANTGGLTVAGYDSTLMELASNTGYGQPIVPTVAAPGLQVIKIQDGENVTYALWGPGYWDETTDPEVANGWARVYNDAVNLTYAEWNDRKAIGQPV